MVPFDEELCSRFGRKCGVRVCDVRVARWRKFEVASKGPEDGRVSQ